MKRFFIVTGVVSLLGAATVAAEQSMLARITVYWASGGSGSDHWTRQHIAASGARLRPGHCAVDPRRIPYGSQVSLPDGTLTAVDTGSAVRSRRAARRGGRSPAERNAIVIDRFFETKSQALAWARRNPQFMTVKVSSPNESPKATAVAQTRTTTSPTTTVAAAKTRAKPDLASRAAVESPRAQVTVTTPPPPATPKPAPQIVTAAQPRLRSSVSTVRSSARVAVAGPLQSAAARGTAPITVETKPTPLAPVSGSRPSVAVPASAPRLAANSPSQNQAPAAAYLP